MVIGNGLISSAFINDYQFDDEVIIFASGVSNSLETDPVSFKREELLLQETIQKYPHKKIIYFTSFIDTSIKKIKYAQHKYNMGKIIKKSGLPYIILKLPQIMGKGGNPNNLLNYIIKNIISNNEICVYKNTYKAIIDVNDVKAVIDILVKKWGIYNLEIGFSYIEKLLVEDIIKILEDHLNKKANIKFVESIPYDFPEKSLFAKKFIEMLEIEESGYTEKIIKKYI